jgi:alcohol dehydrogenase class IV
MLTRDMTAELTRRIHIGANLRDHGDKSGALDALRQRLHAMRRTSSTDTRQYVEADVRSLLREFDAYWHRDLQAAIDER